MDSVTELKVIARPTHVSTFFKTVDTLLFLCSFFDLVFLFLKKVCFYLRLIVKFQEQFESFIYFASLSSVYNNAAKKCCL